LTLDKHQSILSIIDIIKDKAMQERDDFMSGRNQKKGNSIAMIIGLVLLSAMIVAYLFFG
jgi:hypothetical protein